MPRTSIYYDNYALVCLKQFFNIDFKASHLWFMILTCVNPTLSRTIVIIYVILYNYLLLFYLYFNAHLYVYGFLNLK